MQDNLEPNIFRDVQAKVIEALLKGNEIGLKKGIIDEKTYKDAQDQTIIYIGIVLDAAILFGVWLNKTQQGGADKLTIDEIVKMFFEKAARLNIKE